MNEYFRKFAALVSSIIGQPKAFVIAITIIVLWVITGPIFGFSNTWQLVINTFTTITTFLIVFLIQNTQNRDSKAIQIKLDELIRSTKSARNTLVDLEEMSDEEIETFYRQFQELHSKYQKEKEKRNSKLR